MERGWSTPYGYSALALQRVWNYMHSVLGVRAPVSANTFPSHALAGYGPFPYNSMALVAGHSTGKGALVFNTKPDPRAYLATAARTVRDFEEATTLMRAGHDFHHVALVEDPEALLDPSETTPTQNGEQGAAIVGFAPERIVIATTSTVPALLVLAEPWFPGWTARVNGVPAPCMPVNAWMRATPVPAGRSEVVMTFRSTYLLWGMLISLAALVVVSGLLIFSRPSEIDAAR
jgi:hypothetical protein